MFRSSSSSIAMNMFVITVCACAAALAVPEDAAAGRRAHVVGSDVTAPVSMTKRDAPIPNVSEDVLEKALNDRRFVQRQLKCATGEGPCDPIGRKIKAHAPLVLRGMCVKCSPAEVKQIQRVMSHIQKNYPKEYAKMINQYQNGF
ncbi:ejaculatory bulb-specific protein 3-like [Sipha flava]|uniref:Ejaculatory bulb-specific protein 3 n=1 Tax=Sipha flava TaxID=143950 RepID=A0A2S2QJL2_9HEMI|nr:ejaculatory bulb-specific protein 3-like [Sipha flava]